jgi:ABC-type glycerol-3-phosphate transport system permease component
VDQLNGDDLQRSLEQATPRRLVLGRLSGAAMGVLAALGLAEVTSAQVEGQPTEMAAVSIIAIIPPAILAYLFQSRIRSLNLVDPL